MACQQMNLSLDSLFFAYCVLVLFLPFLSSFDIASLSLFSPSREFESNNLHFAYMNYTTFGLHNMNCC